MINKSAGETILHRAAKQGLPDIAAYALSMAKMSPTVKDNGGIPPIHKAAFHGHQKIVELLLKFGTDPNTNVKGTRPLHEALEGGSRRSVHQLLSFGSDPMLYDYSGNMPIDLAEGNDDMHEYFGSVLADLHGKESKRWNVSDNLPLHMCGLTNLIACSVLFTKLNKRVFEFFYFAGIIGGIQAFLTPQINNFDGSTFEYISYHTSHAGIILIPIFLSWQESNHKSFNYPSIFQRNAQ